MTFRRNSGLGFGVFAGVLFFIIALALTSFTKASIGLVSPLVIMGAFLMMVNQRIELDFPRKRYRIYWNRLLVRERDYKALPDLQRIQVRDVIHPGGRADSEHSWGDTYSYEIFLMTPAKEKLVICKRSTKSAIRSIVKALAKGSGLPVRDVTKEQILA